MAKTQRTLLEKILGIVRPLFWLLVIALAVIWATRLLTSAYRLWWFALIALPAAWVLYVLRVFQRAIYGFVEVVIGIITVMNTYTLAVTTNVDVMSDTRTLMTLAAGIYIVIRGLDNIDQGLRQWCATFLHPDDALSAIYYWEVGVKGRFLSRKLKRGIYLKMARPLFKEKWIEFEELNRGVDKAKHHATGYWWSRKYYALHFMNERAVKLCRVDRHESHRSKRWLARQKHERKMRHLTIRRFYSAAITAKKSSRQNS